MKDTLKSLSKLGIGAFVIYGIIIVKIVIICAIFGFIQA